MIQIQRSTLPEMSGQPHDIEFALYVFDFIIGKIRAQWGQTCRQQGYSGI